MEVFLGTDHAGFDLKEEVKGFLEQKGYEVQDCGAHFFDKDDDYPDFISLAAKGVSKNPDTTRGIIFGGSGQGEAMVANKIKGVRCVVFYGPKLPVGAADASGRESTDPFELIRLAREHNNANMLSFGARFVTPEETFQAVELFLRTPFSAEERHKRRIDKIKELEH